MDTHPSQWQATLLDYAFWRDAEAYNKPMHDSIEAEGKRPVHHRRFPFTLSQEQPNTQLQTLTQPQPQPQPQRTPDSPMPDPNDTEAHRHRRFSMSDALLLNPFHSTHLSRRRARSSIRSDASDHTTSSQEPVRARPRSRSRSRSLLRLPLTILRGLSNTRKRPDQLPNDHATPANPILEFRGGDTWDLLARDRKSLGLDLFWPIEFSTPGSGHPTKATPIPTEGPERPQSQDPRGKGNNDDEREQEQETFPLTSLTPLLHFRHLRALKLTGMMSSYQKYIWQAAWLNPHLEELELGMALAPSLRRNYVTKWPCIRGGWTLRKESFGGSVYYGTGTGTLHPALGLGEYLDKMVIEKSKVAGMGMGRTRTRLSIRTLVLSGFVVDADPFLQWFDCGKLKCVRFRDGCVDAGLWLGEDMGSVTVVWPGESGGEVGKGVAGRVVEKGEIRMVRLL
ncbi:hypothetical protein ABOM_010869 [Aspergillus bombycis]|uniref:Uncharacterized protein n=1 Tax=Aspergillus bombycis TaxID=109264 RepID=A0A1F7ZMR3_9EURO|nr:hypothetical protein ABOM_010869 [Aspergillus bombycis]OGM40418.1 hypothetical protein ABOM_010869 [Aspergillus bombycis]